MNWVDRLGTLIVALTGILTRLSIWGIAAIVVLFTVEYGVNNVRPTDHWVKYYLVLAARDAVGEPIEGPRVFKIGSKPEFFTQSEWFIDVPVAWPDVMWCLLQDGPNKGRTKRYTAPNGNIKYPRKAGITGFYEEDGTLVKGSTPGYWDWEGDVPKYAAQCQLEANPVLYPSPFVERHVVLPLTDYFYFR